MYGKTTYLLILIEPIRTLEAGCTVKKVTIFPAKFWNNFVCLLGVRNQRKEDEKRKKAACCSGGKGL